MSDWWKEGKYRAGKPYKSSSGELLFYNKKDNILSYINIASKEMGLTWAL